MDIVIVIVLCAIGILLILVEIFLIPGITFTAIAGVAFSIGGIYYSFKYMGPTAGVITLIAVAAAIGLSFVYLIKSKALNKIALQTDINSTVFSKDLPDISEGDTGIAISRLNPIGKVRVNNITMEAKTLGGFIDENTSVKVTKVFPTQLIVISND